MASTEVRGSINYQPFTYIYINFEPRIGVPNAFTPNGDGINDIVRVEGKGFIEFQFMIFNRWGEKYLNLEIRI